LKTNEEDDVGWQYDAKWFLMMNSIQKILSKVLLVALVLDVIGCSGELTTKNLKNGDLLFVVNGHGNNITSVTKGVDGLGIDHVAVFSQGNIIEAIPEYGVVESPLDSFMVRLSDGESVLVGRVEGLDVDASVANARKLLGKPYDDIFMPSDSAIYCSELVQKSFVFEGSGLNMKDKDDRTRIGTVEEDVEDEVINSDDTTKVNIESDRFVFGTIPMSFHDSTGKVTEFWTKFYVARGLEVPEGEPGTNPGQLSRDPSVKILGVLDAIKRQQAQ